MLVFTCLRTRTFSGTALMVALVAWFILGGRGTPAAEAHDGPALTPAVVEIVVSPGQDVDIEKTVHTPAILPKPDILLLADSTSSMSGAIADVQAQFGTILSQVLAAQPQANFGVAHYTDQNCPATLYVLHQAITGDAAAVQTAINGLATISESCNTDAPEDFIHALYRLATDGDVGWRTDSSRIIVLFGDSSSHDPSNGRTLAETIAALNAAQTRVVAVNVPGTPGFLFDGLDNAGQATALATATGGIFLSAATADEVASTILNGLQSLLIDISMASDCVAPVTTTFSPSTAQTVVGGADAVFIETISVAADAAGGTYECDDWALINGNPMVDAAGAIIKEHKIITVPEAEPVAEQFLTGGGRIGRGSRGYNFGGNVGHLVDGSIVGEWQFNANDGLRFHSTFIQTLQFTLDGGDGPAPPDASANIADFSGKGRVKQGADPWIEDCDFTVHVEDRGEPGVKGPQKDVFGITITCSLPTVATGNLEIDSGNLQIHAES